MMQIQPSIASIEYLQYSNTRYRSEAPKEQVPPVSQKSADQTSAEQPKASNVALEALKAGAKSYLQAAILSSSESSYDRMSEALAAYHRFSNSLRRSESINTYIDNSGNFNRVGDRASIVPINQVPIEQRGSVRHAGTANEGTAAVTAETAQFTLAQTTRAIEAYNAVARAAKEAQTTATYLQNSMTGLNTVPNV